MIPEPPIPEAYWIIPGRLLAGPYPRHVRQAIARQRLDHFLAAGITLFVDLTEADELPPYDQFLDEGTRHLRLPIPDMETPTPEQMARILDVIDAAIGTRHTVYVHCRAGLGRTGTVVGCFMARHGKEGAEALRIIQRLRQNTPYPNAASPETAPQRQLVLLWEEGQ
jgi:protein-tyrosine phosphatase